MDRHEYVERLSPAMNAIPTVGAGRPMQDSPKQVQTELQQSEKSSCILNELVRELEARLQPVLRPDPPSELKRGIGQATEPLCSVAASISDTRLRVDECAELLRGILHRLAV